MKIGFIGAGKVATAFGVYIHNNGYKIAGFYSRCLSSSEEAAKASDSISYSDDILLVKNCDIIFITTNDDSIESVCQSLADRGAFVSGQIVVHMSGALSSKVLISAEYQGCYTFSMHPLQSFANFSEALSNLKNSYFSIEGISDKIAILKGILDKTGNPYFILNSDSKTIYHAAACVFSNYLVTLMDEGLSLLDSIGIERKEGFKSMLPLIQSTLNNISLLGTEDALTGPIARGDSMTIEKHIAAIGKISPEKLDLYKLMASNTLLLAVKSKLKDIEKVNKLEKVLYKI